MIIQLLYFYKVSSYIRIEQNNKLQNQEIINEYLQQIKYQIHMENDQIEEQPEVIIPTKTNLKSKTNKKIQTPPSKTGVQKSSSKESKGSVGSKGSTGNKPNVLPNKPIVSKPPVVTTTKPQIQRVQLSNAQQQQQQIRPPPSKPQIFMPQPRRQPQVKFTQNGIFNDDEPIVLEQKKQKVKQMKPYNLQQNLTLELKCRQKLVKLSSKEDQLFPFMVNIKTKELTEEQEQERSPIDLICVIDVSGSMCGEKIDLVRKTLINLLEIISPKDRLCLIEFDDQATRLTPLLKNSQANIEIFKSKISKLRDRGGTDIAKGMNLAFKVIKERKMANPITSVFLLTDGLDSGAQQRTQVSLVQNKLLSQNFSINCFGFGKDHDEDLLNAISKYKDGNFYFVQKLDTVDQCFAEALGGLMSVVALDVNIYVKNAALKPFEGISIKQTFGDMWNKAGMTSGYKINISQLFAGVEKGYVGEIIIPKSSIIVNDKQRSLCILEAELTAKDKSGKIDIKKDVKLIVQLINEEEQIGEIDEDGEVMQNYFRVKGAEAIQVAIQLANHGKYEQGKKQLQSVIVQINTNKKVNQEKLKPTLTQLISSEQYCEPKVYDMVGKKKMVSNTKQMMEQKAGGGGQSQFSNNIQTKMVNIMKSKKC